MSETLALERAQTSQECQLQLHIYSTVPATHRIQLALFHEMALFQSAYKSWFADELLVPDIMYLLKEAKIDLAHLPFPSTPSTPFSIVGVGAVGVGAGGVGSCVSGFALLTVDEFISSLQYNQRNPASPPSKARDFWAWKRFQPVLPCALFHPVPVCSRQAHALSPLTASKLWVEILDKFPLYADMTRIMPESLRVKWQEFHNYGLQHKVQLQALKEKAKLEAKQRKERKERKLKPPPLPRRAPAPTPTPIPAPPTPPTLTQTSTSPPPPPPLVAQRPRRIVKKPKILSPEISSPKKRKRDVTRPVTYPPSKIKKKKFQFRPVPVFSSLKRQKTH